LISLDSRLRGSDKLVIIRGSLYACSMARIARVVVPGIPHHITQRGNRRQQTFFRDDDYHEYLSLMAASCRKNGVDVWAYCLMPNHVHMIAVPHQEESLRSALGEAHRRYTRMINFRHEWRGHLWQERFASFPMDGTYLLATARYVELNPVRGHLVNDPARYRWSSCAAHLQGTDDELVRVEPLWQLVGDWGTFLSSELEESKRNLLRQHERTGRPLGDERFTAKIERLVDRIVHRQTPCPKKKS